MHALKAILGHKSIQLTVDLYGNFKANCRKRCAEGRDNATSSFQDASPEDWQ